MPDQQVTIQKSVSWGNILSITVSVLGFAATIFSMIAYISYATGQMDERIKTNDKSIAGLKVDVLGVQTIRVAERDILITSKTEIDEIKRRLSDIEGLLRSRAGLDNGLSYPKR